MNTVILLRRNPEDLSEQERGTLCEKFGSDANFVRTDPVDYKEHAADCAKIQPVAVLLPLERPIPSQAMEDGFAHIAFTPRGLGKLEPLKPSFQFDF